MNVVCFIFFTNIYNLCDSVISSILIWYIYKYIYKLSLEYRVARGKAMVGKVLLKLGDMVQYYHMGYQSNKLIKIINSKL